MVVLDYVVELVRVGCWGCGQVAIEVVYLRVYGSVHVQIGSPFHLLSFTERLFPFLLCTLLLMYNTLPQPTRRRALRKIGNSKEYFRSDWRVLSN